MSKPREYWIVEELERYPKYPNDAYEEKPISGDFIHVIEYSAYVELLAKLEAAEKKLEQERAINAVLVEALNKFDRPEGKEPRNYDEVISRNALTKAKDMRDE